MSGTEESAAPKKFVFAPSGLSSVATSLWKQNQAKLDCHKHPVKVELHKKSFGDFAEKATVDKSEEDDVPKPVKTKFIFGVNVAQKVSQDTTAKPLPDLPTTGAATEGAVENAPTTSEVNKPTRQSVTEDQSNGDRSYVGLLGKSKRIIRVVLKLAKGDNIDVDSKSSKTTDPATLKSGEENDDVIFQNACKLHVFDKERKAWVEKGLATIRISQQHLEDHEQFRIIARTTGNHRVVINSKIDERTQFERVDNKRIRLVAMGPDSPVFQTFLIAIGFSKTDLCIDMLCHTLEKLIPHKVHGDSDKANEDSGRKRKASETTEHKDEVPSKKENKREEVEGHSSDGDVEDTSDESHEATS